MEQDKIEKIQKNYKRIMALKKYRDQTIQNTMFVGVCNLIDKYGLEDRKMEYLQRIKKHKQISL